MYFLIYHFHVLTGDVIRSPPGLPGWDDVPYINSFTLCLRAYTIYFRPKPSPVSYAVNETFTNEIYSGKYGVTYIFHNSLIF